MNKVRYAYVFPFRTANKTFLRKKGLASNAKTHKSKIEYQGTIEKYKKV